MPYKPTMTTTQHLEYVQLAPNEDVNSIRDRLTFIRGKRVLLIWPENGTALTRKLDLVLVQREARRRAIQLALVTHDNTVIENAGDLGISTFETIKASERARWKRGRTRLFIGRDDRPEAAPEPEHLMPVASRVRQPRRRQWGKSWVVRLGVLLFVLVMIGGVAYVVLPSAVITVELSQDILQTEVSIIASPTATDIDIDGRIVPATVLRATVQTTGSIATSGVQDIGDLPAIGVVVFTNQTAEAVPIPINTTVSTSAGTPILFKTTTAATVPAGAGQRVEVPVEAMTSAVGNVGNVATGLINTVIGPLDRQVSVLNVAPTTGGESRALTTVTAEDQDRLLAIVRGQLQAMAFTEMSLNLTDSQRIVIETIRIPPDGERQDWITFSHAVGAVTDTLSLEMRALVEATAIDDRFARQIVLAELSAQKPEGLLLLPESFQYMRGGVLSITNEDNVVFTASGQATITGELDSTTLAQQIAGKSSVEAQQWLLRTTSLAPNSTPQITLEPSWLPHLPLLPFRIQFQTQGTAWDD
jgi:hypothetical protein